MKFLRETLMLTTAFLILAFQFFISAIPVVWAVLIILKLLVYKFPLSWFSVVVNPFTSYLIAKTLVLVLGKLFILFAEKEEANE